MDYQTKLNEVRYRSQTVSQHDTDRMSTLRMLERRRSGGVFYTWRRMFSQNPYFLLPGGYALAYFIGFQTYSTVDVVAWYLVLMVGIVGPLMLWLGVFGIFQRLRDNTRFGLGWVVFGMVPIAIFVTIGAIYADHLELDLRGMFDDARAGRDAWEAARWLVANRTVPLATVIGAAVGVAGGIVLLGQGLRRHSADVSQPLLAEE